MRARAAYSDLVSHNRLSGICRDSLYLGRFGIRVFFHALLVEKYWLFNGAFAQPRFFPANMMGDGKYCDNVATILREAPNIGLRLSTADGYRLCKTGHWGKSANPALYRISLFGAKIFW